MSYGALGLIEVLGSANAVLVVDKLLKTADVEYKTWNTKCGGHVTVFISGDVSAVTAAVEAVEENPPCQIFISAVISNPSDETKKWAEANVKKPAAPTKKTSK